MKWDRIGSDDTGLTAWRVGGDEERHLLVLHGGELREVHEVPGGPVTVHVYATDPALLNDVAPLSAAEHVVTYEVAGGHAPWVRALDDRELIEWLMAASYVDAA